MVITPTPKTKTDRIKLLRAIREELNPGRPTTPKRPVNIVWSARLLSKLLMLTTNRKYCLHMVSTHVMNEYYNLEHDAAKAEVVVSNFMEEG